MRKPSYSQPAHPHAFESCHPRAIIPLQDPPAHLVADVPSLPAEVAERPPRSSPLAGYAVSTHMFPAAYPRQIPHVPVPESIKQHDSNPSLSGRRSAVQGVVEEFRTAMRQYLKGDIKSSENEKDERLLWSVVNRYCPLESARKARTKGVEGVTLFLSHANGFSKEIWEPFLSRLMDCIPSNVFVDEIWSLDVVQHGDAGLINADKLGMLFDWKDNARDFLNFFTCYLPDLSSSSEEDLPTVLPRLTESTSASRKACGFTDRTLVTICHSFSATSSVLAALEIPSLFTSMILVDPVITCPNINRSHVLYNFLINTMLRRQTWPSRDEARKALASSPFFGAWDSEVLDAYVRYCLAPREGGDGVRLKLTAIQETSVFNDGYNSWECFERLSSLDPRIELFWVMAGKNVGENIVGAQEAVQETVWRRPVNCSNVILPTSGHLIAQEKPTELAQNVAEFLQRSRLGRQSTIFDNVRKALL